MYGRWLSFIIIAVWLYHLYHDSIESVAMVWFPVLFWIYFSVFPSSLTRNWSLSLTHWFARLLSPTSSLSSYVVRASHKTTPWAALQLAEAWWETLIALFYSYLLDSTRLFLVSVVFHYNWAPPNVHGVVIATPPKLPWRHLYPTQTQHNNGGRWGDGIPASRCKAVCQIRVPCGVFYLTIALVAGFQKWWFIFVKKALSWLIEWRQWLANWWHAVCLRHILDGLRLDRA